MSVSSTGHTALQARRLEAVRAWTAFVERGDEAQPLIRPEILNSWRRSGAAIDTSVVEAPMTDESDTASVFKGSPLQIAVERVEDELRRTAEDGDLGIGFEAAEVREVAAADGAERNEEDFHFPASTPEVPPLWTKACT